MKSEYSYILIFIVIGVGVACIVELVSYILADQKGDREKISAYECGFDAFDDTRNKFDVSFYLVGILFIIFDIEASYLFPWGIAIEKLGSIGYWGMIDFIVELVIGYIYVWRIGALNVTEIGDSW